MRSLLGKNTSAHVSPAPTTFFYFIFLFAWQRNAEASCWRINEILVLLPASCVVLCLYWAGVHSALMWQRCSCEQSAEFLSPTLTRFPWQHNKQLWPQEIPDSKWLELLLPSDGCWFISLPLFPFFKKNYLFYSSFSLFYLLAVIFWWRSDLQPSLDRVRSASTTCLRPEPNFHFLDRDRYDLLLLKWTIPRCSTCSFCWVILIPLSFSGNVPLLFVVLSATKPKRNSVFGPLFVAT